MLRFFTHVIVGLFKIISRSIVIARIVWLDLCCETLILGDRLVYTLRLVVNTHSL